MTSKTIVFCLIVLWGLPAMQLRSQFRKMVYQTNDWKINIKPLFLKEIKALFVNTYIKIPEQKVLRNRYRIYLLVYALLWIIYNLLP